MPNVFVLCTGRCGSVTFAKACGHATNYTAGHESRAHVIGADRLEYPRDHIEVDNRLSWFLGRLDAAYGDDAYYVHLYRDVEACARSFERRAQGGIMAGYRHGIAIRSAWADPYLVAKDMIETVTANIRAFLVGRPNVMLFPLEQAGELFPHFWHWIGAEGDSDAALREWSIKHNASREVSI